MDSTLISTRPDEGTLSLSRARRAALGSFAGAVVDWYDFLLYGITAALVFNREFFPQVSPAMGTLAAFATFGVGFLFRPLGGVIFGHFGDRLGRKRMLMLTVWMMGIATALIGILPSFSTIGWWAPILLVTLLSSAIVGWLLVRYSSLPGNTGAWGSSPGGAAAMVAMAQDYGADIRLVAFMQYLRVLFVAGAAVLVTRMMLGDNAEAVNQHIVWFPPVSINLLLTILLAVVAGTAGCMLRLPSGTMLIPMLAGAVLQSGQLITIELPEWLLAMAYMAIGWRIGLGFDKQILLRALRPLPQILLSIFALLAICAGMAWGLTRFMHIDFMTAYLATSPGGLDTVAVIAAGSNADMALIMAMQTLRLFSILLTGPAIARFISTYAPKRSA